ncbi:dihydropteroate synthase [soil metagenome]
MRRVGAFVSNVDRGVRARGVALVGVCNVTPDSFSDGGEFFDPAAAKARIDALVAEGADIVDVGGESTKPGAKPVSASDQLERVLPAVRYAATRALVSIDTTSPEVADACLEAGAVAINDVSCLRDPALADVAKRHGAALWIMHSRSTHGAMIDFSTHPDDAYGDVVDDVAREWEAAAECALARGVQREALVFDPGLGFAKNARHSRELLARTRGLVARVGVPVMIGASRKSFLRFAAQASGPTERLGASIGAAIHAWQSGARLVRVHDVRATRQAIDVLRAMEGPHA